MDNKQFKGLQESIKIAQNSIKVFEGQVSNMEKSLNGVIENLDGKEKQKIQELQAMVNIAMNKAKKGGDYNSVIDRIKETFKKDLNNGGKNS